MTSRRGFFASLTACVVASSMDLTPSRMVLNPKWVNAPCAEYVCANWHPRVKIGEVTCIWSSDGDWTDNDHLDTATGRRFGWDYMHDRSSPPIQKYIPE